MLFGEKFIYSVLKQIAKRIIEVEASKSMTMTRPFFGIT